jgi:pimeloyl-ACP methyl ester carboxylesterase
MPRALTAALTAAAVLAGGAVAQADPGSTSKFTRAHGKASAPSARAASQVRARALKASGTLLHECDDPADTLCGSIDVPLDRSNPTAGTIPIFFALMPHTDPGPAVGTILASSGGPGISTTGDFLFTFLFDGLRDKRDVLLIDLRGTGRSGAIDCPDAQQGIGVERDAVRKCGAQLGAAASRYGSADRAEDTEAVRAALGIPKLDYYGISAGGTTVQAYAARHGDRLRSVILDSSAMVGDESFFSSNPPALERAAVLICKRSPTCSAADRDPLDTLRDLIRRVRNRPLAGVAPDDDGQPQAVVLDEHLLINTLANDSAGYLNHSEISAAARALDHGDRLPLLRLAAENDVEIFGDAGDPRFFSTGDFYATWCTDGGFPWDETAPSEATRQAQYDAAAAALRGNASPTYALADFPRLSLFAQTPAVEPKQGDRSTVLDRKVARMAWAATYDAIQRTFRAPGDRGAGLRGGTFSIEGTDTGFKNLLDRARFAADVAVSGESETDFAGGGIVTADLTVDGPGGLDGTLQVSGQVFPHTGSVSVRGTIGGRRVAVLVPTTDV